MSPYIFFVIISTKLLIFYEIAFLDGFDADILNKISNACKYVSANKNALYTVKIAREIHSNTKRYLPVSTCRYKKALLFAHRMDFRQIVSFPESNGFNV